MGIRYSSLSEVSVPLVKRGSPRSVSYPTRTPYTSMQCGAGCDVVFFGERDFEVGKSRLNAVVITRRPKAPTAEERALPRNRLRVIAAKTRYHALQLLPWFLRRALEPSRTQVNYESNARILTVDDKVYGPLAESETLIVMFDTLSDPMTQATIVHPTPTTGVVPTLREGASVEEWREATRSARHLHSQESTVGWNECVKGVPVAAEFVRVSNEMAG